LFHVEECGDDINNCEEQVITEARFLHYQFITPLFPLQRGPKGKDFMDDYDYAHGPPRPVRVRSARHPNLVKAGTCAHCLSVFSFSSQFAAAVPITSRARHVPRAQTQQMASTLDDHRE
jgi:hypothetical protein